MAKKNTINIRLRSTAETGYFYIAKKNPRKLQKKLEYMKYDPVARKHVLFKEVKDK
jgi:large subunit ribosomal protein L33